MRVRSAMKISKTSRASNRVHVTVKATWQKVNLGRHKFEYTTCYLEALKNFTLIFSTKMYSVFASQTNFSNFWQLVYFTDVFDRLPILSIWSRHRQIYCPFRDFKCLVQLKNATQMFEPGFRDQQKCKYSKRYTSEKSSRSKISTALFRLSGVYTFIHTKSLDVSNPSANSGGDLPVPVWE